MTLPHLPILMTRPQPEFRIVHAPTLMASRTRRGYPPPRPANPAARQGLRYENRVGKQLEWHTTRGRYLELEHNPWFAYSDRFGAGCCCPDFLLWDEEYIIVVEVKLTWVPVAFEKLAELYCPTIAHALQVPTTPLVICRNITPYAPPPSHSLREALETPTRLLHWPDNGRLVW